ncbi:MAG: hypothetical protein NTX49_08255 [Chlamydiae bacterium]|nr:hypothetical protein [Chlamydiota bacterium]
MASIFLHRGYQVIQGIKRGLQAVNSLSLRNSTVNTVAKSRIFQAGCAHPDRSLHPIGYHVTPDHKPFLDQMNQSPDGLLLARPGSSINSGSVGGLFVNLHSPDHALNYAKGLLGTGKDLYVLDIGAHQHAIGMEETFGHPFISAGSPFQILEISHVKAEDLTPRAQEKSPTLSEQSTAFMEGFRAELSKTTAPRAPHTDMLPCPYNIAPDGQVELSTRPLGII